MIRAFAVICGVLILGACSSDYNSGPAGAESEEFVACQQAKSSITGVSSHLRALRNDSPTWEDGIADSMPNEGGTPAALRALYPTFRLAIFDVPTLSGGSENRVAAISGPFNRREIDIATMIESNVIEYLQTRAEFACQGIEEISPLLGR